MKAFALFAAILFCLAAAANAVTYTSYGISDLDCTDVARLIGIDRANGGDNDDENHLVMGSDGDLFVNIGFSVTVPRDLPSDDTDGQVLEEDITIWNFQDIYLVVSSDNGFYAFGTDADTIIDNNSDQKRQSQLPVLTHLVPIDVDGVDSSRNAIELSLPISVGSSASSGSGIFLFAGYNEVGFFAPNALNLPQFTVVNLTTGEISIKPTFLEIEDDICNIHDIVASGIYERTEDSFTVLCAASDGIVRLTNTGNIDEYAWGPFEFSMDMHDLAADWFRPENGTWYFKSEGYTEGAWFGDVAYPDSDETIISCRATYNMVEESGDGDGGDGDGDGDAASTLSAFLFNLF